MEISITRRIVGAIVLGLLAVIIVPQIFDGGGRMPDRPKLSIPQTVTKPDTSQLSVELPIDARSANHSSNVAPVIPLDNETAIDAPNTLDNVNGVWSLQIASFKDNANAASLRDGLRDAGFRSYNKESKLSDNSLLTQVMVGPVQDYDEVLALKEKLKKALEELNIIGPPLVVKYSP